MGATAAPEPVITATLLVVSYALVRRVRFQLGTGLIRPTQIVFVPMLFLTPAAAVPLLVTLGGVLGELPDLLRRRAHPERLAVVIARRLVRDRAGASRGAARPADDARGPADRPRRAVRLRPGRLVRARVLRRSHPPLRAAAGARARLPDGRDAGADRLPRRARVRGLRERVPAGHRARGAAGPDRARALASGSRGSWSSSAPSAAPPARWMRARTTCAARPAASRAATPSPRTAPALERVLLATTVEALRADAGRLSEIDDHGTLHTRLADRRPGPRRWSWPSSPSAPRRRTRSRSASGTATCWR